MSLIIASYRFRLIQLCKGFLHQGYITEGQLEQLIEFYKLYKGLGGNGQAEAFYNKAIALRSDDGFLQVSLGNLYAQQYDYKNALIAYEKAKGNDIYTYTLHKFKNLLTCTKNESEETRENKRKREKTRALIF